MQAPYSFFLRFKNRTLILMLAVAVLVLLVGFFIPANERYAVLADTAFLFAGVVLLLKNGSFLQSKYVRFLNLSFAIFLAAILFKILHLPGADVLLIIFPIAVTSTYTIWFISKPSKQILDVLKLFWVPVFLTSVIVKMLRQPYSMELYLAQLILFVAMLIVFISKNSQRLLNS